METVSIFGYARISVDDELDRDNTSIENQKEIIYNYVENNFSGIKVVFYEDRDRSGYTFEQREGYQALRPLLMNQDGKKKILIVKDFSRFSRRNSRGLVELEDLRDAGVRIISIGDGIDYPTYDDWVSIQFRFLVNEMPVTDTSKKVKNVIQNRQKSGNWICSVPYGYTITNTKTMTFSVDPPSAEIVKKIFELYNSGWGYKKISNWLTDQGIPTPRTVERAKKEAVGEECKIICKPEWSIVTIQGIISNDFYIGTLRQGKYTRKKINGTDLKKDESEHLVFENHHEPIVEYKVFSLAQQQLAQRTKSNYRGIKKYDTSYSGFLFCGDCGSPMFSMSRVDLSPAYTCGSYHRRGLKGCSSHHTRVDILDRLVKRYIKRIKENSSEIIKQLEESIKCQDSTVQHNEDTIGILHRKLEDAKTQLKALARQKVREITKNPANEDLIDETYSELEAEQTRLIMGLQNQIKMVADSSNDIKRINRIAKTAFEVFDDILSKPKLDKVDLQLIIQKIVVYEDHIDIKLQSDIDAILRLDLNQQLEEVVTANFNQDSINISKLSNTIVQSANKRPDKVYTVNVISEGDPLQITLTKKEVFISSLFDLAERVGLTG